MANAGFTEFSYGYALTDNLLRTHFQGLKRAPIFPSLVAEGRSGGGYDIEIPLHPVPLFLQFKVPIVIRRRSKLIPPDYWVPYYRFVLRTWEPNQHQLLLDLEKKFPLVFYVAPLFDKVERLDEHFVNKQVHSYSTFIQPSRIGPLDNSMHYVAFQSGASVYWRFSEPRPIEGAYKGDNFLSLLPQTKEGSHRTNASELLHSLWAWFIEIQPARQLERREAVGYRFPEKDVREQARQVAYLAQVRLGLTLALLDPE